MPTLAAVVLMLKGRAAAVFLAAALPAAAAPAPDDQHPLALSAAVHA